MSYRLKARLLLKQGKSTEEVLDQLLSEADAQIQSLDRLLVAFIEESPPELVMRLMPPESLGAVD